MRTTIDKAGRVVIPASLRDQLGLTPGPVDIFMDGNGIRIEIEATDNVVEENGLLLIEADGSETTPDDIRELRLADQR